MPPALRSLFRRPLAGLAFAALVLAGALGAAPAASAANVSWQKSVVTYRDVSPYGGSVKQAVAWINAMPGELTLRRAPKGTSADITIRAVTSNWAEWGGVTEVGYYGRRVVSATVMLNRFWYASNSPNPDHFLPEERAYVTTHELLHAVGLPHYPGCSMMRPAGFYWAHCGDRDPAPLDKIRCGPQRKDAQALVNRYGGKLGAFDGFFCPPVDDGTPLGGA